MMRPSKHPSPRLIARQRLLAAAVASCFATAPALGAGALPAGATNLVGVPAQNIVYGTNSLTITTAAARSAADWAQFSIGAGNRVDILQPSVSSAMLNRVLSADPSRIYGTLTSNGQVFLVNQAGIQIGPGGMIDTARFVASTLNLSPENFLAGRLNFDATPGAGSVSNQGTITTPLGGSVYLIAPNVSNEGIIRTPQGETILAAGQTVSLIDTATPGVKVDITGAKGNATNLGTITAEAGRIGIAGVLVRNSGTLNASSLVSEGGRIFLKASQDAYVDGAGRIVTTGTRGGKVEVLGDRVAVTDQAEIDVSGATGGGTLLVGGDYQGKNPDVHNAGSTYFGSDARLKADATDHGDGGKVIVWADGTTRAYGTISARGGANGGNGGFVEVSGKRQLYYEGFADRRAPKGKAGSLLLDPDEVEIGYGGTIAWTTIVSNLYGGNVDLTATGVGSGNIKILDDGSFSTTNRFGLLAKNNIDTNGRQVTNLDSGDFVLVAGWNGSSPATAPGVSGTTGSITGAGNFSTAGGNFTALAAGSVALGAITTDASISGANAGNITISGTSITLGNLGANGADGSSSAPTGGRGGEIRVTASAGDISLGGVSAKGGNGYGSSGCCSFQNGGDGGNGGKIILTASGMIVASGTLSVYGGHGGDGAEGGKGGNGGNGGDITLLAGGAIDLQNVEAWGGWGGSGGRHSFDGPGGNGGNGGNGGTVQITGSSISVGEINASGSSGGHGADGNGSSYDGGAGGAGGDGGKVALTAKTGGVVVGGSISANAGWGGHGGHGGSSDGGDAGGFGGAGGKGGTGGSVQVDALSQISITGSIGVDGGEGGNGGHGGYGSSSALAATPATAATVATVAASCCPPARPSASAICGRTAATPATAVTVVAALPAAPAAMAATAGMAAASR